MKPLQGVLSGAKGKVRLGPFVTDREPVRPEIQRPVKSSYCRLGPFRREETQAEISPAFEVQRIGLNQLPKDYFGIRDVSASVHEQRSQSCRLPPGEARSVKQCGGFPKFVQADEYCDQLEHGEGIRRGNRDGLSKVGQSFPKLPTTNVEHRHEDAQAEVARMLTDRLPSGRDCLLEFAASGMIDRLSAKRRNLVHAQTYSRCRIGCIDEHRLVATLCRDG